MSGIASIFQKRSWTILWNQVTLTFQITKKRMAFFCLYLSAIIITIAFNIDPLLIKLYSDGFVDGVTIIAGRYVVYYAFFISVTGFLVFTSVDMPEKWRRRLGYFMIFFTLFANLYFTERLNGVYVNDHDFFVYCANITSHLLIFAIFYTFTANVFFTCLFSVIIVYLFALINYLLLTFRGVPMLPWDILALSTAADVASGYTSAIDANFMFSSLAIVALLVFVFRTCKVRSPKVSLGVKLIQRTSAAALSAFLVVFLFMLSGLYYFTSFDAGFFPHTIMRRYGSIPTFISYINVINLDQPENYSPDSLIADLPEDLPYPENYPLGTPESEPTVILIINESLIDPRFFPQIELTDDPLPYIHSLMDNNEVYWGRAYAGVFGGSTCNSEFEVLTSDSTAMFPAGSRPFQLYCTTPRPSMAKTFLGLGYSSTVMHPGSFTSWFRHIAYPNLGFEQWLYRDLYNVEIERLRNFPTDETCFNEIIYQYENNHSGAPQFLYNLTYQNHGPYSYPSSEFESTFFIKDNEDDFPLAAQYFTSINHTDRAFEDLISYFSDADDPVMIFMVGDHWPQLEQNFSFDILGIDDKDFNNLSGLSSLYQVPYLIWANYPMQTGQGPDLSLNYLGNLIYSASHTEFSEYSLFVNYLSEKYPIITPYFVADSYGTFMPLSEAKKDPIFDNYYALIYNQTGDTENLIPGFFYP